MYAVRTQYLSNSSDLVESVLYLRLASNFLSLFDSSWFVYIDFEIWCANDTNIIHRLSSLCWSTMNVSLVQNATTMLPSWRGFSLASSVEFGIYSIAVGEC